MDLHTDEFVARCGVEIVALFGEEAVYSREYWRVFEVSDGGVGFLGRRGEFGGEAGEDWRAFRG